MKEMLGVNLFGVLCLGKWILLVIAVYKVNTQCSASAVILIGYKKLIQAKETITPNEYINRAGM
jgi:hypothetical protein